MLARLLAGSSSRLPGSQNQFRTPRSLAQVPTGMHPPHSEDGFENLIQFRSDIRF